MTKKDDFNPLSLGFNLGGPKMPADNRDPDAYADIGWLKGKLEALNDKVEANGLAAEKRGEKLFKDMAETKTAMSEIKVQVADVSDKVDGLSSRVQKTEERLTTYNNWTQQLKGSWRTIAFFWLLVGGALAAFGKTLLAKAGVSW